MGCTAQLRRPERFAARAKSTTGLLRIHRSRTAEVHANGQFAAFTYGNGALFSQSLNLRGLPLLRQDTRNTWTRLLHHTFAYDANANVSSILDGAGSEADYTDDSRWLGYDGLDRLTVANSRDQNALRIPRKPVGSSTACRSGEATRPTTPTTAAGWAMTAWTV